MPRLKTASLRRKLFGFLFALVSRLMDKKGIATCYV